MSARKFWILTGEGIECERESQRFFALPQFGAGAEFLPVPAVLSGSKRLRELAKAGDWVMLPGGFSFADHYGSGKLLAFELKRAGFLQEALAMGVNLIGFCNGFQVLTETRLFGDDVRLLHNRAGGKSLGFRNRWVDCRATGSLVDKPLRLCIRHGEGRLSREGAEWRPNVRPILHYRDAQFSNGSIDEVAGLEARHGSSRVIGMMPHPEVSWRRADDPDALPTEIQVGNKPNVSARAAFFAPQGDGAVLVKALLEDLL
jgi:phosphoribosylformylglycinamidine synthase